MPLLSRSIFDTYLCRRFYYQIGVKFLNLLDFLSLSDCYVLSLNKTFFFINALFIFISLSSSLPNFCIFFFSPKERKTKCIVFRSFRRYRSMITLIIKYGCLPLRFLMTYVLRNLSIVLYLTLFIILVCTFEI